MKAKRAPARVLFFVFDSSINPNDCPCSGIAIERLMNVDVENEIVIARPVAVVAAFVANPDNATAWYENIKTVEWMTADKSVAVGAKVAFVARFLGRRMAYTYEFIDYDPASHLVMKTAQGPFPMETHYRWSPVDDTHTRMVLRNCGEPAGFAKLTAGMMAAAMGRANRKDLARLKSVLEAHRSIDEVR